MTLTEIDNAWTKYIFIKTDVEIKGCDLCVTVNGERIVIPLKPEGATHPISECVVKHMSSIIALEPTVDEGRLALAHIILKRFTSSLLWVLYYQTKTLRKKVLDQLGIKGYEPLGNLYSAELNLFFACLHFWDSNDLSSVLGSDSALDLWNLLREEDISHHLSLPWAKRSKEDEEKAIQYRLDCLNSWKNPYLPEQLPHQFNMIELAIAIAEHRSTDNNKIRKARREFRDGAWQQYKEALHRVKRALHTNPELNMLHLDGYNLYAQKERQRRVRIVSPTNLLTEVFAPNWGGTDLIGSP